MRGYQPGKELRKDDSRQSENPVPRPGTKSLADERNRKAL